MDEYINIIVPVIVALLASIPGILSYISTRRRDEKQHQILERKSDYEGVEVTGTLLESAVSLVAPLNERIAILESEYNRIKNETAEYKRKTNSEIKNLMDRLDRAERNNFILCEGVRRLAHQIRSLGGEPVFDIDEELCKEMEGSNGENSGPVI